MKLSVKTRYAVRILSELATAASPLAMSDLSEKTGISLRAVETICAQLRYDGISTGIAGPGGGSPDKPVGLVYIALADKYRVWVRKAQIHKPGRGRKYIRQTASSIALNMVRKYLMALPGVMPGLDK